MKIEDETLLDQFRGPGNCEHCGKRCQRREPHHYLANGIGGGGRIDVPFNLIALGASKPFPECYCHTMAHQGNIEPFTILAIIAARVNQSQDWIKEELWRIRRLPKGSKYP